MAKPATFFANFPVHKQPSTFEVIRRYRSTYEGCDLVPLVTSSIGNSELTRTVRKSDYNPALALPKHMAGILDEKCREKKIQERQKKEQI